MSETNWSKQFHTAMSQAHQLIQHEKPEIAESTLEFISRNGWMNQLINEQVTGGHWNIFMFQGQPSAQEFGKSYAAVLGLLPSQPAQADVILVQITNWIKL